MSLGNIVPLIFAIPLVTFLAIREFRWRKRLREWTPSTGTMIRVEQDPGGDNVCPVIEYAFEGRIREKVCEFNLTNPNIGDQIPILVEPNGEEVFMVRSVDRWTLSGILLLMIVFLVTLSILSN